MENLKSKSIKASKMRPLKAFVNYLQIQPYKYEVLAILSSGYDKFLK